MQIDYQQEFAKSGAWRDPSANIDYGCGELAGNIAFFEKEQNGCDPLRAAVAAYNCGRGGVMNALAAGRDVDAATTGHDYSKDVMRRRDWFEANPL